MSIETNAKDAGKAPAAVESVVDPGSAYAPDADIVENGDSLAMYLDLPGVPAGGAAVEVDENNILTVRAKNAFREPEGRFLRQARIGDYYRAFQLGAEYDRDRITAALKDGVLTVTVPKREEARTKRIEIKA
jgi:HSP20 family molecular chaperone IbpA